MAGSRSAIFLAMGLAILGAAFAKAVCPDVEKSFPQKAPHETVVFFVKELQQSEGSRKVTIGNVQFVEVPEFSSKFEIGQPLHLTTADVNNDGYIDLVLTTFTINGNEEGFRTRLWTVLGEKTGFQQPSLLHEVEWYGGPAFIAAAEDLDNDGCADFVLLDFANKGLWIFFGDGEGGLKTKVFVEILDIFQPVDLAIVDLDEDGNTDFVVAGLRTVHVLWGTTQGVFYPTTIADYSVDGDAVKIVVGDFDRNGRKDLAVLRVTATVMPVEYWIDVLTNIEGRHFVRRTSIKIAEPAEWQGVFALATGDLNGDGNLDLVTARGGFIWVLLGLENGTFKINARYFVLDQFVPTITLHDLSGNGCLNIIVLGWSINAVLITHDCYSEHRPRAMSLVGFPFPAPRACVVVDINRDGLVDLIIAGTEWENSKGWTILSVLLGEKGGQ